MNAALRARVVAEARSWIGTPYHHQADQKGIGVDCAMMLLRVYQAVGIVPTDLDPRPYPPEWYLHRDEERYLGWVERYCEQIPAGQVPQPGDIGLYKFGRCVSHGGIVLEGELLAHAFKPQGAVNLCELGAAFLIDRLVGYWELRT